MNDSKKAVDLPVWWTDMGYDQAGEWLVRGLGAAGVQVDITDVEDVQRECFGMINRETLDLLAEQLFASHQEDTKRITEHSVARWHRLRQFGKRAVGLSLYELQHLEWTAEPEAATKPLQVKLVRVSDFVETVKANVDNEKLTDSEFRRFIRDTLPIVDTTDWYRNCQNVLGVTDKAADLLDDLAKALRGVDK